MDLSAPVLSFSLSPLSFSPALVIFVGNSADVEKEKKKKKRKRVMLSSSLLSLALLFLSLAFCFVFRFSFLVAEEWTIGPSDEDFCRNFCCCFGFLQYLIFFWHCECLLWISETKNVQQSKKKETWWRSPLLLCMLLLPWFWQAAPKPLYQGPPLAINLFRFSYVSCIMYPCVSLSVCLFWLQNSSLFQLHDCDSFSFPPSSFLVVLPEKE